MSGEFVDRPGKVFVKAKNSNFIFSQTTNKKKHNSQTSQNKSAKKTASV